MLSIMAKQRNYKFRDADMLLASRTVAESFKAHIAELSTTRALWTEQYANDLVARIETAITTHLGIDTKKELRDATATMAGIQVPAFRDLSYFRVQLTQDFKKEPAKRDELLVTLGFSRFYGTGIKSNQTNLILLLKTFKSSMTAQVKQDLIAKGMSAALIDNIMAYAESMQDADVTQEYQKESTKHITGEAAVAFNAIYDEVIAICRIAATYYKFEPLKKDQFTFAKIIRNRVAAKKSKEEAEVP